MIPRALLAALVVSALPARADELVIPPPPEPFELPPVDESAPPAAKPNTEPDRAPARADPPQTPTSSDGGPPVVENRVRGNPEPFTREHGFSLGLITKAGYSIGHLWNIPFTSVPTPGVGLRGRYRLMLAPTWRFTVDGSVSIGGSDDGSAVSVGSYRATAGVGHRWFDFGWFQWWTTLHAGFESFFLIPVPLMGVSNEFVLTPIRWSWLIWSNVLVIDTDLYVIVPSVTGTISSSVVVPIWFTWVGAEVIAEGQGIVAGVANSVGGSIGARLLTGFVF